MTSVSPSNTISGRSAFIELLKSEGITHLFGNPGTTELPIMHALADYPEMRYVLGLQEAIVIAMADGYARASGELVACNVHVAPGLGNAMGSLFTAFNSGTPLIVTAGQQEQGHGLTEPLLYAPLGADRHAGGEMGDRGHAARRPAAHRSPRREGGHDTADRTGVYLVAGRHPERVRCDRSRAGDAGRYARASIGRRPACAC